MRLRLLLALPLAAKGCAPDLDPGEHRGAYLIVLGACALAILLLILLRAVGGDEQKADKEPSDHPRDPGAAP